MITRSIIAATTVFYSTHSFAQAPVLLDSGVTLSIQDVSALIEKYRTHPEESFSQEDIKMLHERESSVREDRWPWPLSGRLTNKALIPIQAWVSDPDTFIQVAPFETTPRDFDIDFGQDTLGQWYKISWHHLHIYPDGRAEGYQCKVPRPNVACP